MDNELHKHEKRLAIAGLILFLCVPGLLSADDALSDKDAVRKIFGSAITNIKHQKQRQDAAEQRAASLTGDDKTKAEEAARQAGFTAQDDLTNNMIPFVSFLTGGAVYRSLLSDLEEQRLDKQTEASSGTSGGTSPVSKGSVPSLLGFAVEHGGLEESTNNTIVTFHGNAANLVKALSQHDYIKSWIDPNSVLAIQGLQKLSFSVSFDTSQGNTPGVFTGNKQQLAGASAHIDIYNHRDPRHPDYYREWNELVTNYGKTLANSLAVLLKAIQDYEDPATKQKPYEPWLIEARAAIAAAGADQVDEVVLKEAEEFRRIFGNVPELRPRFRDAANALSAYAEDRRGKLNKIAKSPIVSVEYNFTRQFPEAQTLNSMTSTATASSPTVGLRLPDLSNITLVGVTSLGCARKPELMNRDAASKCLRAPELTVNAAATFFDSLSKGATGGRLRDYRLSAQLDLPLKDISGIGQPRLSFSYLFLSLLQKPLGAKVTLNGVDVGKTGNIHLFQAKLSIPVKDSGIKIPISFTYSNRTELNTGQEKRGTIGITYDFDSLFARPKGIS